LAGCTVEEKSGSTARVEQVIDGDTVRLSGVGVTRLIGVNAPEEGRCGDDAATRFTRRRLEGERVKYERGEDSKDRWRRTLAYLRRSGTMHNLALVEEGYATAQTIAPNDKYAQRFEAAEEEAKQQEKGPLADCAEKRKEDALRRARAKERAERAERAEELARKLRAAEKRAKEQRQDREDGDGSGGDGSGGSGSGGDGSGSSGSGGDGAGGDEAPKKLRRVLRWRVLRSDPEPTRRSDEPRRRQRRAG